MLFGLMVGMLPLWQVTLNRGRGGGTPGSTTTTTTTTVPPVTISNGCPDAPNCLVSGFNHSLILRADGTVDATGSNDSGQLGQGNTTASNIMVQVKDAAGTGFLSSICAIAAGGAAGNGSSTDYGDSYAMTCDGHIYTWGRNSAGNGCLGTTAQHTLPVLVTAISGVTAITAGTLNLAMIRSDKSVWGCGRNQEAEIGIGTDTGQYTLPVQTRNPANTDVFVNATSLAMGNRHLILVDTGKLLYINGPNDHGQIGQNNCSGGFPPCVTNPGPTSYDNPIRPLNDDASLVSDVNFVGATAEANFTCIIETTDVRCEGANKHQNMGLDSVTDPILEFTIPHSESGSGTLTGVSKLAVGGFHVLFIKADTTAGMWGQNLNGEACNSLAPGSPATVGHATLRAGMTGAHQVYAGSHTSFFYDGTNYKGCGANERGQLGIGTNSDTGTPTTIALP